MLVRPSTCFGPKCVRLFSAAQKVHNVRNSTEGRSSESEQNSTVLSRNTTLHSHRKAFVQWATTKGKQYKTHNLEASTNYLDGKSHPFPLNPQFQPRSPTSQRIRESVYVDWRAGAGLRQISQKYGIALERVEAILKLEEVRLQWLQEGKQTLDSYANVMSSMLGSRGTDVVDSEPIVAIPIDPGRQIFTLVPETQEYTPADAARELGRESFVDRRDATINTFLKNSKYERSSAIAKLVGSRHLKREEESGSDNAPVARWQYTIRDKKTTTAVVRNRSGLLVEQAQPSRRDAQSKWDNYA